jgi:hypothetical protein
MSQTSCEPYGLPVPMRWRYAGGDLTPSKRVNQRTNCSVMRSQTLPNSSLHAPPLARGRTPSSSRATVVPVIEAGANIKSP